jgi:hypothetical protein
MAYKPLIILAVQNETAEVGVGWSAKRPFAEPNWLFTVSSYYSDRERKTDANTV